MKLYYINSRNDRVNFYDYPYFVQEGTMFDYAYSYTKKVGYRFNEAKNVRFGIHEKNLKISIIPDKRLTLEEREQQYEDALNQLLEVIDYDVKMGQLGKLYTDTGYYLKCQILGSTKKKWESSRLIMDNALKIVAPNYSWIKEDLFSFEIAGTVSSNNKIYPNKYSHRYANGMKNMYVVNPHFIASDFKLIIYGPVTNPQIAIGENVYLVNIILEIDERLEIDSKSGTVVKIMRTGEMASAFHNRQKKKDFFKKIEPGRQVIVWPGNFAFDLILFEERSEPKWKV